MSLTDQLAIDGGTPVRPALLPYGRQSIDEDDIAAVVAVLRSDWLTTGPKVAEFEQAFATFTGAREAVAVSSGTAALHAAVYAADVGPGDEVIVPAMTFAATANAVALRGATPVFADVEPDTLLLDAAEVERKITARTKAVIAVDYAGQPCDYAALRTLVEPRGLRLIGDACHALGASYRGKPVGTLADLTAFSFHPVKHITTGEGGMVSCTDARLAQRMRIFRNHGITSDHRQRQEAGSWFYEMVDLGCNYRLSDVQCALGLVQLKKLDGWNARRRAIAARYAAAFSQMPEVQPPVVRADRVSSWHLYVIQLNLERLRETRAVVFQALRAENIGVNVHYIPVPWHPYYQRRGCRKGDWPVAEGAYERMLSLPMFPTMTDGDVDDVVAAVRKVVARFRR